MQTNATGRPAYDPRILLKVVLYGYYKGIISSRALAEACRRNVVFMALSADTHPHFTTLAGFVSELHREIVDLFRDVLLYASELGLIGKAAERQSRYAVVLGGALAGRRCHQRR